MFSFKKILLFSLIVFFLLAIPVSFYFISQQIKPNTADIPSTSLSVTPNSTKAEVGQDLSFDINIDPGTNSISTVKLVVLYDATKLEMSDAGFLPNTSSFQSIENKTFNPGAISLTADVGANYPAIIKPTRIGTLTFKALDNTDYAKTQIFFGDQTKTLSNNKNLPSDENLLATTVPANINIVGSSQPEATSSSETTTPTPTLIPQNNQNPEITTTPTPTATADSLPIVTNSPSPTIAIADASPSTTISKPILPPTGPANLITFGLIGVFVAIIGTILLISL